MWEEIVIWLSAASSVCDSKVIEAAPPPHPQLSLRQTWLHVSTVYTSALCVCVCVRARAHGNCTSHLQKQCRSYLQHM